MKKLVLALILAASLVNIAAAKTLVAYFSVPETATAPRTKAEEDSVVTVNGRVLGNTQYVATLIANELKADLFRIEPLVPYTTDHKTLVAQAREEQRRNTRPALKHTVSNMAEYDTVFVGYPIWWADLPMAVYTFLESHDFAGKTIIPFVTHGGSRLAGTPRTIARILPSARVVRDALCLDRDDVEDVAAREVPAWLASLGLKGKK